MLSSIRFSGFRNIKDGILDTKSPEIFFIGDNGQGKTNILEAVYVLCYGSSFRLCNDSLMIQKNNNAFSLEGNFSNETVVLKIQNQKKKILIDDKEIADRLTLISRHPCIVFCHDDISFITGTPENRRWFFDQTLSMLSSTYLQNLKDYKKILRMRNSVLKQQDNTLLDIYDEQLAVAGLKIMEWRNRILQEFKDILKEKYKIISGVDEEIDLLYKPSWSSSATIDTCIKNLLDKRSIDFQLKTTTSGPHRDRYTFYRGNDNYSETASTGQCRLLALILRICQATFFTKKTSINTILLLDDVLLELDPEKRIRFIQNLPDYKQAFFTFLPGEPYMNYKKEKTMIYYIHGGQYTYSKSE